MASFRRKRIAFVIQRYGAAVNGGAELEARMLAQKLSGQWEVEVFSTCALDYMTWEDYFPEGESNEEGVVVRRFSVPKPRDVARFNRYSDQLHSKLGTASIAEQEEWMRLQGPMSPGLFEAIEKKKNDFDAWFFLPYLYATTFFGLPLAGDRAYLVPLAHDEWPIYLSMWNGFFDRPQGFVFNTDAEREFLLKRFPDRPFKGPVGAYAVDVPEQFSASHFRHAYGIKNPYVIYIGRIDPSKGCDRLFQYFRRYHDEVDPLLSLVLLGKAEMPVPKHPRIRHLGFVDERTKWDALSGAEFLVNPSPHESLSIVVLETWAVKRPVIVTAECDVLVSQCRKANGGLWYKDWEQFAFILHEVKQDEKRQLGRQGNKYLINHYTWDQVLANFHGLLDRSSA
jgi:glycosyltransferase involved in cell wall biosynthesis